MAKTITCAQLGAALEAVVSAGIWRDGPAAQTLFALEDVLTSHANRDSEPACVAEGPLPVTNAQVDEALAEVRELGVDAQTLRILEQAAALIEAAEKARAAEQAAAGASPVTRAELDARDEVLAFLLEKLDFVLGRLGYADGRLGWHIADAVRSPSEHKLSDAAAAFLDSLLEQMDAASERAHELTRGRQRRAAGQPWDR